MTIEQIAQYAGVSQSVVRAAISHVHGFRCGRGTVSLALVCETCDKP
jgi:hypothetical protein